MASKFVTVKEVRLNNNCPECYNATGLLLTFKQKHIETALYKSVSHEVSYQLDCKTCGTIIYPVRWTDDIERVVEYQQKAFKPEASTLKLKKIAWIGLIIIPVVLITIATLFFVSFK